VEDRPSTEKEDAIAGDVEYTSTGTNSRCCSRSERPPVVEGRPSPEEEDAMAGDLE
jgi:hypothetical protein